ncbi:C1 family peptidase [Candidatus Bathyarchaeota archaeon]|nr:C1 family peptidase [Candidatus Bathyarchaeota archaeon]
MRYWPRRILNLASVGLLLKRYSIFYCLDCRKLVSRTHTRRVKFRNHRTVAFGWRKDRPDPRDLLWRRLFKAPAFLTEKVDLRKHAGSIRDQGNEGSCVGQSGAALKDWHEKYQRGYPDGGLSARCVYNGARALEGRLNDEGAYLRDALKFLLHYGTATEKRWPYKAWVDSDKDPRIVVHQQDMDPWKIDSYVRLQTVDEVLQALAAGKPVYGGVLWYSNWIHVTVQGNLPPANGEVVGGHAILFLGYDLKTGRLLFQNSWGKLYGDGGYGRMLIKDLKVMQKECDFWTVTDRQGPGPGPRPEPEPKPDVNRIIELVRAMIKQLQKILDDLLKLKIDEGVN